MVTHRLSIPYPPHDYSDNVLLEFDLTMSCQNVDTKLTLHFFPTFYLAKLIPLNSFDAYILNSLFV